MKYNLFLLIEKIKSTWKYNHRVTVDDLQNASYLVKAGLLTSLKGMMLKNFKIIGQQMSELKLPRFDTVYLDGVYGDICLLLPQISCDQLCIWRSTLTSNDTKALVNCLNTDVTQLWLGDYLTLDFSSLSQYNGRGQCKYVECRYDSYTRYRSPVTTWAHRNGWKEQDDPSFKYLVVTRNEMFQSRLSIR